MAGKEIEQSFPSGVPILTFRNIMTKLKKISLARNPKFAGLDHQEVHLKLRAELEEGAIGRSFEDTESLLPQLDRLTSSAIKVAELYIEYHLHRGEFLEAESFADDVAELKAELEDFSDDRPSSETFRYITNR